MTKQALITLMETEEKLNEVFDGVPIDSREFERLEDCAVIIAGTIRMWRAFLGVPDK